MASADQWRKALTAQREYNHQIIEAACRAVCSACKHGEAHDVTGYPCWRIREALKSLLEEGS